MTMRFSSIDARPFRFNEFGYGQKFLYAIYHRIRALSCTQYVLEELIGVVSDQHIIPITELDFDLADLIATCNDGERPDGTHSLDVPLDTDANLG